MINENLIVKSNLEKLFPIFEFDITINFSILKCKFKYKNIYSSIIEINVLNKSIEEMTNIISYHICIKILCLLFKSIF